MPRQRRDIVAGQAVSEEKFLFSRYLRREMTPHEHILWEYLRDRRLANLKFRRQQIIDGFIADFYCAETGVVIELDGPIHDSSVKEDNIRDRVIAAHQLLVLRFPNQRIDNELAQVIAEIEEVCRNRM